MLTGPSLKGENCRSKLAIHHFDWDDPSRLEYGRLSAKQTEWWVGNNAKFKGLCITANPAEADWIVTWTHLWTTNDTELRLPRRVEQSERGSLELRDAWGNSIHGTYSSTSTLHTVDIYEGQIDVLNVGMYSFRVITTAEGKQLLGPEVSYLFSLDADKGRCTARVLLGALVAGASAGSGGPPPRARGYAPCGYADVEAFKRTMEDLAKLQESVPLGLRWESGSSSLLITEVVPGLTAHRAGVRKGDLLVSINGRKVKNTNDLRKFKENIRVGQQVSFVVRRIEGTATLQTIAK